ncbi:MAG: S9 family peptidase [Bacteroidetes bacterium]|nr:S9 family peptidase [Bacteroidota bacterium]
MKKLNKKMLVLATLSIVTCANAQYSYPTSKTVEVTDTYFGTKVNDPYRWLESIKSPEVTDWFKAQADYTNAQLAKIPNQNKLIKEFKSYDAMRSVSYSPQGKAGGKYFYEKRLPGEQVAKLYYRQGENGKEILLFDPQKLVEDKTYNYSVSISDDGSKVAFNLSEAGSEIGDIRILDVETVKFLPDIIPHSSGGFADGSNTEILYAQSKNYDVHDPENILNMPFKLHILGTNVEKDKVIVSSKNNPELNILPQDIPQASVIKNSPYMVLGKYTVENNQTLYYAPKSELKSGKIHWKPLTTKTDEIRQFFVHGSDIYFLTSKGNPKFKIIKTSFENPDLKSAKTIAEGNNDWQISSDKITQTKDFLIITKSKNELLNKVFQYDFKTGKTDEIKVPLKGNLMPISWTDQGNELVLVNIGWTTSYNFNSYDVATKKYSDGFLHMKFSYPNIENIAYEEVEVPSWDGTLVPLSIIYDKTKLKKDGSNIAFMQGYGAYGMNAYIPFFNPNNLSLLNRGVVIAFAHIRGGGEKGNEWYLAGKKATKPNTWKDFNACAEWLIKNKYTSADKFGISGASAGGILIGRAITERPDLYKVAIPKVGCLDAIRMEFSPNGPVNTPEFGTVTKEDEFKALLEMDAYQHIQKGVKYPAQLITTGFNDPRVDSYIPAKFAAKMQNDNGSQNPVYLYVDYSAGHFGGSTMDEQFAQQAKEYAFLLWQCGDKEFQE